MPTRFNPPPNWPPAPAGWSPPPGWQPDPSWGPPPNGWALWTDVRANPGAWKWAFGSALAFYLVLVVLAAALLDRFGAEAAGRVLPPFLLAGAAVGLGAWLSRGRWPRWLYPILVLPAGLFFSLLIGLSRMQA